MPRTRSAPLPLVGRGWGWGSVLVHAFRATTATLTTRGRGVHRVCDAPSCFETPRIAAKPRCTAPQHEGTTHVLVSRQRRRIALRWLRDQSATEGMLACDISASLASR